MRKKRIILALLLVVTMFSSVTVYANSDLLGFDSSGFLESRMDNVQVKADTTYDSETVLTMKKGDTFYTRNSFGSGFNSWIEVDDFDGNCYGYIESKFATMHTHSFKKVYGDKNTKKILSVCRCGYSEVKTRNKVARIDCQKQVCRLLAGNYSTSELTDKDKLLITGFDAAGLIACATAETNPVSAGVCLFYAVTSFAASARDLTADVYYCSADECNVGNLIVDGYNTVSGIPSIHVAFRDFKKIDANRVIKSINDFLPSNQITVFNDGMMWYDSETESTIDSSNCVAQKTCCSFNKAK